MKWGVYIVLVDLKSRVFLFFWLMLFFIVSQLVVVDVVELNGGTEIPICPSREVCLATDVGFSLWFYMNFFLSQWCLNFSIPSLQIGDPLIFFISPQQVLLFDYSLFKIISLFWWSIMEDAYYVYGTIVPLRSEVSSLAYCVEYRKSNVNLLWFDNNLMFICYVHD